MQRDLCELCGIDEAVDDLPDGTPVCQDCYDEIFGDQTEDDDES